MVRDARKTSMAYMAMLLAQSAPIVKRAHLKSDWIEKLTALIKPIEAATATAVATAALARCSR